MITPEYDSAQRPSPILEEAQALLRYRDFVLQLIARNVLTRYKRSVLGVAWTMLSPLLTMAVLTLVFSGIFGFPARTYALYVLSGLLLWNFFAQSTRASMNDLVWSGGILGHIYVPKAVFAMAAVGTGVVNLLLALVPYALIAWVLGAGVPLSVLLLPGPVLLTALFALGIGLVLSTLAVFFADVIPMYDVVLTAWMYLTPVIYPIELVPQPLRAVLRWNPMVHLMEPFRALLLAGEIPTAGEMSLALGLALGALLLGWWVFARRARDFAYHV